MQNVIENKEILKIIQQNIFQQELEGHKLAYCLCQKLNNSGIMYNKRFFLLHESQYIAYKNIDQLKKLPFTAYQQIGRLKNIQLLEDIKNIKLKSNGKKNQLSKTKQILWKLKMNNQLMAKKWKGLLQNAIKSNQRKLQKLSPIQSQYNQSSQKSIHTNSINFMNRESLNNIQIPVNQQLKNQNQSQNQTHIEKQEQNQMQSLSFSSQKIQKLIQNQQQNSKINLKQIQQQQNKQYLNQKRNQQSDIEYNTTNQSAYFQQIFSNAQSQQVIEIFNTDDYTQKIQYEDWNFQLLVQNQQQVIRNFKLYSEKVIIKLIDQFCQIQSKRQYRPKLIKQQSYQYYIHGLYIKLAFNTLQEVLIYKDKKQYIISQNEIKKIQNEFKNMNYLFQKSHNQGLIRVGLCTVIEYKGFVCIVKNLINQNIQLLNQIPQNIINQLSRKCNIQRQVFYDKNSMRITKVNWKGYQGRHNIQNKNKRSNLGLYYITDAINFLPRDLFFIKQGSYTEILRSEYVNSKINRNMLNLKNSRKIKTKQNSKIQIQDISNQIPKIIENVVKQWQNSIESIIYTTDLSQLFHKNALNMRYLGLVYQNSKINIIKQICMSEIYARVIKSLLRVHMAEQVKNLLKMLKVKQSNSNQLIQFSNQFLKQRFIIFLNQCLDDSSESSNTFQLLKKQTLHHFKINLNIDEINKKYFLTSLVYHCNIQVDWKKVDPAVDIISKKKFFNKQLFVKFCLKSKIYQLKSMSFYNQIKKMIDQKDSSNYFKNLIQIIKNKKKLLIIHDLYIDVVLSLANSISSLKEESQKYLGIFQLGNKFPPNYKTLKILLYQLNFNLKQDKQIQAIGTLQKAKDLVIRSFGNYHPILTQFYQQLSINFANKNIYDQALSYSKISLINMLKSFQINHSKIAESYFLVGNLYMKLVRKQQALIHFKKAKIIYQEQKNVQNIGYIVVCIKKAILQLNKGKIYEAMQTLKISRYVVETKYNQANINYQDQFISIYELLFRCFQIINDKKSKLFIIQNCTRTLLYLKQHHNFQKCLRMILSFYLKDIPPQFQNHLIKLFQKFKSIKQQNRLLRSLKYIYNIIKRKLLIQLITEFVKNCYQYFQQIYQNKILQNWNNYDNLMIQQSHNKTLFQIVSLLQAFYFIFGEDFIIGIIIQSQSY